MTNKEMLAEVREKLAKIKHENFGVLPYGRYVDEMLETMWWLEARVREEEAQ